MNICFISKEYPPETGWGGIGTYIYNIAHALVNLGHRVDIISQTIQFEKDYEDNGVYVHRIKLFNGLLIKRIAYYYQILKKIKSIDCKFDIIEIPEWGAEGFPLIFLKKSYRLVTRLHTPLFLARKISHQRIGLIDKGIDFLEKEQTKHSHGITSPTKALANIVATKWNIPLPRIKIIPNGIDLKNIKSISSNVKKPEIDEYITYIGRLQPLKGLHILARSLLAVFKQYPNLKIVFIGQDTKYGNSTMKEYILDINKQYKKNLIFTGFLTGKEKYSWIKYSKFVVLPSLWESFGYTCLESMAIGKAVIATKNSGFEEIIEDNKSGFLVEPGNSESLKEKIIYCLNNNDVAELVGKKAMKRAEEFNIENIARTSINYYKELLRS